MFFIAFFGVQDKEKQIGTCNNAVCPSCGHWTRFDVFKTYTYFHIFLIPTFRWNVRYVVKTFCCGSLYELDPAVGKEFEQNPNTEIRPENLKRFHAYSPYKFCRNCQTQVPAEYLYCPYCGGRL